MGPLSDRCSNQVHLSIRPDRKISTIWIYSRRCITLLMDTTVLLRYYCELTGSQWMLTSFCSISVCNFKISSNVYPYYVTTSLLCHITYRRKKLFLLNIADLYKIVYTRFANNFLNSPIYPREEKCLDFFSQEDPK